MLKLAHFVKQIKCNWELWNVVLEEDGETDFVQLCGKWRSTAYSQRRSSSVHTINRRKCNLIGHILLRNCLIGNDIARKKDGRSEVTGRSRRRHKQPQSDLKERRSFGIMNEGAVFSAVWSTRFGRI